MPDVEDSSNSEEAVFDSDPQQQETCCELFFKCVKFSSNAIKSLFSLPAGSEKNQNESKEAKTTNETKETELVTYVPIQLDGNGLDGGI